MTEKHLLLSDLEFEQKFEDCTLPPVLVTYEAHLRLAYIHLKKYGIKTAIINLYKQLTAFNVKFGHILVLTKSSVKSFVKLVYEFIKKSTTTNFNGLLLEFPDLKTRFLELIVKSNQVKTTTKIEQTQKGLTQFSAL